MSKYPNPKYSNALQISLEEYLEKHPEGMLTDGKEAFWPATDTPFNVDDFPQEIWTTYPQKLHLCAPCIVSDATEEMHEDAYEECDVYSLQSILDDWCEKQNVVSWYKDMYRLAEEDVQELRKRWEEERQRWEERMRPLRKNLEEK